MSPAARRRHLLARIHRRFETITEPVHVGALDLKFTRVRDPNVVLDQVAAEEDRRDKLAGKRRPADELHLPYWAELWDSAVGIGQMLVRQQGEFAGRNALDLGCGMGLAGARTTAEQSARLVVVS